MSRWSVSPICTDQYDGRPLVGAAGRRLGGDEQLACGRPRSGRYQRVGRVVSNSAWGRRLSATTSPSISTRTWRSLGSTSTRLRVSRAWTCTSSASSYQATPASQAKVQCPATASMGGRRILEAEGAAPGTSAVAHHVVGGWCGGGRRPRSTGGAGARAARPRAGWRRWAASRGRTRTAAGPGGCRRRSGRRGAPGRDGGWARRTASGDEHGDLLGGGSGEHALHHDDIEPVAELPPDLPLGADDLEAAGLVQGDGGGVAAHDPGHHRVEAVGGGQARRARSGAGGRRRGPGAPGRRRPSPRRWSSTPDARGRATATRTRTPPRCRPRPPPPRGRPTGPRSQRTWSSSVRGTMSKVTVDPTTSRL